MTFHNYIFFNIQPSFHNVPDAQKNTYKKEFLKILQSNKNVVSYTYSILGFKAKIRILIWFQSDTLEEIQNLLNTLMHTQLGMHLLIVDTLFGMTRPTQYSRHSTGHLDTFRKGGTYLIVYPFTKTQSWYMLDFETRKQLMAGHIAVGKNYPQITQLLLYSYGIDNSEFIVSYETDDLSLFQSLVIDLRADKVREYTLKDTPIFTCIYKTPEEVLEFL